MIDGILYLSSFIVGLFTIMGFSYCVVKYIFKVEIE